MAGERQLETTRGQVPQLEGEKEGREGAGRKEREKVGKEEEGRKGGREGGREGGRKGGGSREGKVVANEGKAGIKMYM